MQDVGTSEDEKRRVAQHFAGDGSAWTRLHPPVEQVAPHTTTDGESGEREETLELMLRYGIEKVRGWRFTRVELTATDVEDIEKDLAERNRLCRRCGRSGHLVGECFARTRVSLVRQ